MWLVGKSTRQLPEATGPFVPGCMDVVLDHEKTGITMRLYYPTEATKKDAANSSRWSSWFPDDRTYLYGVSRVLMIFTFVIRLLYWWCGKRIVVMYGAPIRTVDKLKCCILSHGLGGHRNLYSNTCCELASRGFLVVALEHRDDSSCHTFYYKSVEDAKNKIPTPIPYRHIDFGNNHFPQRKVQVEYRAKECINALDFLLAVNKGKVPYNVMDDVKTNGVELNLKDLVGNLDVDTITMMGHSFGGATALLALSQRSEFKQGVLLDPWMFPIKNHYLYKTLSQPLVFINTQTFHIATNVEAMSKYLTGNHRTMYTILHTTHENQTDSVLQVGYWLNWFMKKLDPLLALNINNSIILNFLNDQIGCPAQDCRELVEQHKKNIKIGLTKPWA